MRTSGILFAAMLLAVPTSAFAARGIVTTEESMSAGPGTGFPVVDRIPGGARVTIHGCLRHPSWGDVSWDGERGWVSADRLEYFYRNRFVYLPDYAEVIEYPVVPFVLGSYWASHYASRPFYHRRAYWNGYWQSQGRLAARTLPSGGARAGARAPGGGGRAGARWRRSEVPGPGLPTCAIGACRPIATCAAPVSGRSVSHMGSGHLV